MKGQKTQNWHIHQPEVEQIFQLPNTQCTLSFCLLNFIRKSIFALADAEMKRNETKRRQNHWTDSNLYKNWQ